MKCKIFFIFYWSVLAGAGALYAQCPGPTNRTALLNLQKGVIVEGTRAGQIPLTDTCGNQRYAQYVEVNLTPIDYTPTTTGNTENLSEFVTDPGGVVWYIDWQGNAQMLSASPATCDEDWLQISDNSCPESLLDSIYKYSYTSIGARQVWPGARLFLCDSTVTSPNAHAVILGERTAGLGLKTFSSGDSVWTSYRMAGTESNVYLGLSVGSWNVRSAGNTNPAAPSIPFDNEFSIYPPLDVVRFWKYPSSRDDTTAIVNVLTTDASGYLRSQPVSAIVSAGGGVYTEGQGIDITSNVVNLGAPDSLTSLITSRRYLNAQNSAATIRMHGARSTTFVGPTFPTPYLDFVNTNTTDGPGATIQFYEKSGAGALIGGGRLYSYADGADGGLGMYAPGLKFQSTDGPTTFQASNNIQMTADANIIASGDSVQLSTIETLTKFPFALGYNSAGTLKKIAGSTNGQVLTWQDGGWQAIAGGSPSPGTGGIYGGSGTMSASGTATASNSGIFTMRALATGDGFESGIKYGQYVAFIGGGFTSEAGTAAFYGGSTSSSRSYINANGETGQMQFGLTNSTQYAYLESSPSGPDFIFVDNRDTKTGIEYDGNYHAGYTDRSLVDKEYVDDAIAAAAGSLTYWVETQGGSAATALSAFRPKYSGQSNVSAAILPKGTGAIIADSIDNTAAGGNARGNNAVDLMLVRSNADEVASGILSALVGGSGNKANGDYAGSIAGQGNSAGGEAAGNLAGANNVVTGQYAANLAGNSNNATGANSRTSGAQNTAAADYSSAGGRGAYTNVLGSDAMANGTYSGSPSLGDAQTIRVVMRGAVTGSTAVTLYLDGTSDLLNLADLTAMAVGSCVNARVDLVATCSVKGDGTPLQGDTYISSNIVGIRKQGTNTALVGTVTNLATQATASMTTSATTITADDTNDALSIVWTPPSSGGGTTSTYLVVATVTMTVVAF